MGRVPLPPQIAFLPCTSPSQDKSKARLPIGREMLGHWSIESLRKILGRLDDPVDLAIQRLRSLRRSGAPMELLTLLALSSYWYIIPANCLVSWMALFWLYVSGEYREGTITCKSILTLAIMTRHASLHVTQRI
ncbi:hypothetical protein TNCV_547601 [Trichonephila clavipes]|nr:hypothetical protein TNCV_547601 [Trichonephila clavipes]